MLTSITRIAKDFATASLKIVGSNDTASKDRKPVYLTFPAITQDNIWNFITLPKGVSQKAFTFILLKKLLLTAAKNTFKWTRSTTVEKARKDIGSADNPNFRISVEFEGEGTSKGKPTIIKLSEVLDIAGGDAKVAKAMAKMMADKISGTVHIVDDIDNN